MTKKVFGTNLNEDNEISARTFLFGGDCGSVYDLLPLEGFHCFEPSRGGESADVMKSFDNFKTTVQEMLGAYDKMLV